MTDATDRLSLPLLQPGQAQKELFHNEALALVDLLLPGAVEAVGLGAPPADAAIGQAWVVGPAPTGDWAGRAGAIDGLTAGGWRFAAPVEGMAVWSRADGCAARFLGGGWTVGDVAARRVLVGGDQVVGARRPAIAPPAGGQVVDAEARVALAAIVDALVAHGLVAGS